MKVNKVTIFRGFKNTAMLDWSMGHQYVYLYKRAPKNSLKSA